MSRLRQAVVNESEPSFIYLGEKRLLVAVLERAFLDLNDRQIEVRIESYEWFTCDYFGDFSFLWVVQALNLEDYVGKIRDRVESPSGNFKITGV